jgi:hypothetical protein
MNCNANTTNARAPIGGRPFVRCVAYASPGQLSFVINSDVHRPGEGDAASP